MPPKPSCLCGECRKCRGREWARRNSDKRRAYAIANYEKESERKAKWRAANRERLNAACRAYKRAKTYYQSGDPKKLAQKKALHAVKTGRLVPQPCEVCGEFPLRHDGIRGVIAHHDDYDKPLDVRWLCTIHHGEEHRLMNIAAIAARRDVDEVPFQ